MGRCLCGAVLLPREEGSCGGCKLRDSMGPSVLKPIGEIAQLIERTSFEDMALFTIAMNRRNREKADAEPTG